MGTRSCDKPAALERVTLQSMEDNGNEKVNAIYLANLPADYVRPNGDDPA